MASKCGEQGAVALLVVLLLVLAVASLFLAGRSANLPGLARQQATTKAMAQARKRLIAYTVMYADNYPASGAGPGHLPCPDTNNNGSPNPPCAPGVIGRLPRAITLPSGERMPISDHGDGYDQRLWYALSSPHRNNPAGPVNSETIGTLHLDGAGDLAAVFIAPGASLAGQNRPGNSGMDYLEDINATGPPGFVSSSPAVFNDRVLLLRSREFMPLVERRVLGVLRDLLRQYRAGCGQYPWAVPYGNPRLLPVFGSVAGTLAGLFPLQINTMGNPAQDNWNSGCAAGIEVPAWLIANKWHQLSYYAIASDLVQGGGSCAPGVDCIVVHGLETPGNEAQAVVLLAGAALAGQNRSSFSGAGDYFEGDNANGDQRVFAARKGDLSCNDQLLIVH